MKMVQERLSVIFDGICPKIEGRKIAKKVSSRNGV
jgi:hypothetical protein